MTPKLTRQGVRDLGNSDQRSAISPHCSHNFCELVIVGYRTVGDDILCGEEPVYGEKCGWCGEVRS